MQDRFKFRIVVFKRHTCNDEWGFDGYIEDDNTWHLTSCGDIASVNCYYAHYRRDNAPDSVHMVYEPEFCTGLKDKNGKLIYEGDIVRDRNNLILKVVYKSEKASFALENWQYIGYVPDLRYQLDTLEVIGNIYENPELLEVKNE